MTKKMTLDQLRELIKAAPIKRTAECFSEEDIPQRYDTTYTYRTVTHWACSQEVHIEGLIFYTQKCLTIPKGEPTQAEFTEAIGWDWVSVEHCDIEIYRDEDFDDDIHSLIHSTAEAIDLAITDGPEKLEVAQYYLSDWPDLVPEEDPYEDPDKDSDKDSDKNSDKKTTMNKTIEDLCSDEPEERTVERDNEPNIIFTGWELAYASSRKINDGGRWTQLTLYRTKGGKYIASTTGITCYANETNRHSAEVCDDIAGVIEFFGYGSLGKEIYADLDLDTEASEHVE